MTTFLDQAEIDRGGGAVGRGKFYLPESAIAIHPSVNSDRLALRFIIDGYGNTVAKIYPVTEISIRGISPDSDFLKLNLELPPAFVLFLREHLRHPKPTSVCLEQQGGEDWDEYARGLCKLKVVERDTENPWNQVLTNIKVSIVPDGTDRIINIEGATHGPASRWQPEKPLPDQIYPEGSRISASVRISRANQCVVFGAWPGTEDEFPRIPFSGSPNSTLGSLDMRNALVCRGAVFAWSSGNPLRCWNGRSDPMRLHSALYGRRSDGLLETDLHTSLTLDLTMSRVEELLRFNRSAKIDYTNPDGHLGYTCEFSGYPAVDEGQQRRNVLKLGGKVEIDIHGLAMRLRVHFSDVLPDTIGAGSRPRKRKEVLKINLHIYWETLILAQSKLLRHASAILEEQSGADSKK